MGEVENRLFMDQLKETIWNMVDQLETRQAEILKEHDKDGESLKEIAAKRNISAERARQIREKGLAALREYERLEVLEEYAQGLQISDSIAYRGSVGGFHRTGTSATEKAALHRMEARARAGRQYPKGKSKNPGMSYSEKMAWLKIYGQHKQSADALQLKIDTYRLNNPNGRLDGLADLPGKLEAERGKEQRALKELLQALESVKDPDFSKLLCLRYVQLKKWKQIANEMGLSAAHCKGKLHRMAVDALELSELKS
jgi:DNA-directed RNA polymerase specialized sigma24 family protein